ncbi:MAG: DUF1295 domain-containing protein [Desulfobacteraceae bacterium]|nr:DUF1295 domain-containing protein [Desulfobacteraceae bacterium]
METLGNVLLMNLAAVLVMMTMGWLVSLLIKNVTIVDSLWGLGFVVIAWLTLFHSNTSSIRPWLIAALVTVWGLRLAIYLTRRNWGKGEDPRYETWRTKSGGIFWLHSFFKVFILQALFMWVISLSMQFAQLSALPKHLTGWDMLGTTAVRLTFLYTV